MIRNGGPNSSVATNWNCEQKKKGNLATLAEKARHGTVTPLYAAGDRRRNNAAVLKEVVEKEMQPPGD